MRYYAFVGILESVLRENCLWHLPVYMHRMTG